MQVCCRRKRLFTNDEGLKELGLEETRILPNGCRHVDEPGHGRDGGDAGRSGPAFLVNSKSAALEPKAALTNLLAERLAVFAKARFQ